jgi:hypothetical protein
MGGAATGITPQESLPSVPSLTSTLFQSNIDGIRIGVPNGWDLEDLNNTDPALQQTEQSYSAGVLVELCPQNQAPPQIGLSKMKLASGALLTAVGVLFFKLTALLLIIMHLRSKHLL